MSHGTAPQAVDRPHHGGHRLAEAFKPLVDWFFDEDDPFVLDVERTLAAARITVPVEVYLTRAIGYGAIAGLVFWLVSILTVGGLIHTGVLQIGTITTIRLSNPTIIWILETARTPALVLGAGIVCGSIGFGAVAGTYLLQPYSQAGARRREIDTLLADAVSFMYALSLGGMSQVEIIETMAGAEDTYGEVSKEFRTILQETQYFDTDYRTAIRNRAVTTPSTELSQFLTDMLSIIDSGGSMTEFLDDKKDVHFRSARAQQEQTLDMLELFSEMYITLSLFPLLLIVVLVIMDMIGGAQAMMLYATVYVLIPCLGIAFLVGVSTVKADEPGDGYLDLDAGDQRFELAQSDGVLNLGLVNQFRGSYYIFERIARTTSRREALGFFKQPHIFFREHPPYTFAMTVPATIVLIGLAVLTGSVPTTWFGVTQQPVWSTVVYMYVPLFVMGVPFAVFWEWNNRRRYAILRDLSEHLRKLASANATGLTLLESIKVVADTTPGRLGQEFETIYAKCQYGMHLTESMVVFNNRYHIPRLARTVKLITKAQEISSHVSPVLSTAAVATETQEDIERERKQGANIQIAIIILTFLTLLGIMALLKTQFIDVMAEVTAQVQQDGPGGGGFGASMDPGLLSLLFFHAVTIQAFISGIVCGYIRNSNLASGVKYALFLALASLGAWVVVG